MSTNTMFAVCSLSPTQMSLIFVVPNHPPKLLLLSSKTIMIVLLAQMNWLFIKLWFLFFQYRAHYVEPSPLLAKYSSAFGCALV